MNSYYVQINDYNIYVYYSIIFFIIKVLPNHCSQLPRPRACYNGKTKKKLMWNQRIILIIIITILLERIRRVTTVRYDVDFGIPNVECCNIIILYVYKKNCIHIWYRTKSISRIRNNNNNRSSSASVQAVYTCLTSHIALCIL